MTIYLAQKYKIKYQVDTYGLAKVLLAIKDQKFFHHAIEMLLSC